MKLTIPEAIKICNFNGCVVKGIGTTLVQVIEKESMCAWSLASDEAFLKFVQAHFVGGEN